MSPRPSSSTMGATAAAAVVVAGGTTMKKVSRPIKKSKQVKKKHNSTSSKGITTTASPPPPPTTNSMSYAAPIKPKRPLTAYNFFFQNERASLLGIDPPPISSNTTSEPRKKRKHRKTHGMIGFKELSRRISTKWSSLDDETRNIYRNKHEDDKLRYKREMKEYNSRVYDMGTDINQDAIPDDHDDHDTPSNTKDNLQPPSEISVPCSTSSSQSYDLGSVDENEGRSTTTRPPSSKTINVISPLNPRGGVVASSSSGGGTDGPSPAGNEEVDALLCLRGDHARQQEQQQHHPAVVVQQQQRMSSPPQHQHYQPYHHHHVGIHGGGAAAMAGLHMPHHGGGPTAMMGGGGGGVGGVGGGALPVMPSVHDMASRRMVGRGLGGAAEPSHHQVMRGISSRHLHHTAGGAATMMYGHQEDQHHMSHHHMGQGGPVAIMDANGNIISSSGVGGHHQLMYPDGMTMGAGGPTPMSSRQAAAGFHPSYHGMSATTTTVSPRSRARVQYVYPGEDPTVAGVAPPHQPPPQTTMYIDARTGQPIPPPRPVAYAVKLVPVYGDGATTGGGAPEDSMHHQHQPNAGYHGSPSMNPRCLGSSSPPTSPHNSILSPQSSTRNRVQM